MQSKTIAAAGLIAAALVACTAITPTQPGTAPGVVPAGGAVRADVTAQGGPGGIAPAQIAPIPPGPGVGAAPSAVGLTVVGEGTVQAPPDIAYVSAGVQSRGSTAREAQDANTVAIGQVLTRIKGLGIAEVDIRTSGVNLQPVYDRDPNRVSGYAASNQITVTVREVKRAGEVLDAAISSGANQSAGVRFGIKDDSQLRRQAVDQAVKSARASADAMAAAAGLRVTGIVSMTDEGGVAAPQPFERAVPMAAAAPAEVPLQPGQLAVTARVRVVYQFQ